MNIKNDLLTPDLNALFYLNEFNSSIKRASQPDVQGTLVCQKVNNAWNIRITNMNGPRVAQLLGRDYSADEAIPIEQLSNTINPQWSEFPPIIDVLEKGKDSPFWDEVFETMLQQPIQIVNPTTQESHIGKIDLQLCTAHFQLGQSYQLDFKFKHYKINSHLEKQSTSIHDLNGVLRTSLTLLNDLQQNPQDDMALKKQKIDLIMEVIHGGLTICPSVRRNFLEKHADKKNLSLTKSNSPAFFQTNEAPITATASQLLPEQHDRLRELAARCSNGLIVLADEIIQQYPVRVLITDNDMPNGLSGVDLITAIRERNNHIKIALHTAIEFDSTDPFISTHDFAYIMKGRHDLLIQFITKALPLSEPDHAIVNEHQGVKFES